MTNRGEGEHPHHKLTFTETFMVSGVAAGIAKTVAAPLERVKLLLQSQGEMLKQGVLDHSYNGPLECGLRTFRNEGFLSFWRGNIINTVRYFPSQGLNFAFRDTFHKIFHISQNAGYPEKFAKNILAGGCAGSISLLLVHSLDYTRTRLANDALLSKGSKRKFKGIVDVYVKTYRSDGMFGLYRGFVISCVGIFIYRGIYFGLYDTLKPILLVGRYSNSFFLSFGLGWLVTVLGGYLSYPFDTVRRRMMMTSGNAIKYKNGRDCIMQIIRNEGPMTLMKGAGTNVLCAAAGAAVLVGYDFFQSIYVRLMP